MNFVEIRKLLSPTLPFIIFILANYLVICEANLVPCRLASQDYALKLVPKLHSCNREFLLVASNESLSCTALVRPLMVSYISHEDFLVDGLHWNRFSSKCVLIAPDARGDHNPSIFVKKVYDSFQKYESEYRKPTVVLLWPQLLPKESHDIQLGKLENTFANLSFELDTDIYTIFTSRNGTPGVFKFSIWEFYVLKNLPIHQKLVDRFDVGDAASCGEIPTKLSTPTPFIDESSGTETLDLWIDDTILEDHDHWAGDASSFEELTNKVNRRDNFRQLPIVGSVRNDTAQSDWTVLKQDGDNVSLSGGVSGLVYWDLMRLLNFSEKVLIGDTPITLINGSLSGKTINQINSREADIALSVTLQVPFRAREVSFLLPTYYGKIHVFFQQPAANSIRNIVTAPFPTPLWLTLLGTWVLFIAIIKIYAYIKTCFDHEVFVHKQDGGSDLRFAAEVGMWAISANCQKSFSIKPSSSGMKMAFMVGCLCSVVSFNAYSAAIMSTLALQLIPVEKFADLVNYNFVFTVYWRSEPFYKFLEGLIEMYTLKQKVETVSGLEEINHLLKPQTPKAFLTYPDLFYQTALFLNYTENFICRTISKVVVSDVIYKSAMFLKKGSEFTEIFNHKLIILKEIGLNYRYVRIVDRKNIFSCDNNLNRSHKNADVESVKVSDVFTAFLVVLCGLLVSSALLLFEIALKKYSQKLERWYFIV